MDKMYLSSCYASSLGYRKGGLWGLDDGLDAFVWCDCTSNVFLPLCGVKLC